MKNLVLISMIIILISVVSSSQALTETKITASDGSADDIFGWALDNFGSDIIVGARDGDGIVAGSGAAYLYHFNGSIWEETKFTASDGALDDHYGSEVASTITSTR